MILVLCTSMGISPASMAFAADEESGEFDSGPFEEGSADYDPDNLQNDLSNMHEGGIIEDSFFGVLFRVLYPRYINHAPDAVVAGSTQEQANLINFVPGGDSTSDDYVCRTNQVGAGTPIYHNCDIPNLSAEFFQSVYSIIDRSGPQNATALNIGSLLNPTFGQSKAIPGGSVPSDTEGSIYKYTGLESFGYDLRLSSYFGEWDEIHTLNEARLLTNFGFWDSVNLGANALFDAIGGAFDTAGTMAASGWATCGAVCAVSGFFGGLFEGGASATMNTIMDTSEANVALAFGWYRANYAETAYGIRELSSQEITAQMRYQLLSYINASKPEDMGHDPWFDRSNPASKPMSVAPEKPVANCMYYTEPYGKGQKTKGSKDDAAPGITQSECKALQDQAQDDFLSSHLRGTWQENVSYNHNDIVFYGGSYYYLGSNDLFNSGEKGRKTPAENGAYTKISLSGGRFSSADWGTPDNGVNGWKYDGAKAGESFNEWLEKTKKAVGNWDASISSFNITLSGASCSPSNADSNKNGDAQRAYNSWLSNCWTPEWKRAAKENEKERQTDANSEWLDKLLDPAVMDEFMKNNKGALDFNSPWGRFVCLDEDGKDVTNGSWGDAAEFMAGDAGAKKLVMAFNPDGSVNSACPQKSYRAPIQDGLFGNGYDSSQPNQAVGNDTRHISNFYGPIIVALYPFFFQPIAELSQGLMKIGQFANQVSNEIITWTYLPVTEFLGIADLVEDLVKSLRDSLFFPLVSLVIAGAALYIIYQAGVRRRYREMFVSIGYTVMLFIVGAILMFRPGDVINIIDRGPANVEKAVMGLILGGVVGEDNLCSTGLSAGLAAGSNEASADWENLDLLAEPTKNSGDGLFNTKYSVADDPMREVLCVNWQVFTYYPWVFAQWGTSPKNLDTENMLNSDANAELVGDASVDFGGRGGVTNNWAVYQLDTMKLGSSTEVNWSLFDFKLKNKDFYRLVDLQAGPNNGEGTDARYLTMWSGMDPLSRTGVAFMSSGVSVLGTVVVAMYSFSKIIISITSVLMLMLLPIVFLIGVFPTKRKFVMDYFMTLLSLALQRVALMLMVSLMLMFLLTVLGAAENYYSVFIGALVILIAFLKFRKPIVDFVLKGAGTASNAFGGMAQGMTNTMHNATPFMGEKGGLSKTWGAVGRGAQGFAPKVVRNLGERVGTGAKNLTMGTAVGLATGRDLRSSLRYADEYAARFDTQVERSQRRNGWGAITNIQKAAEELRQKQFDRAKDEGALSTGRHGLEAGLEEIQSYLHDQSKFEKDREIFEQKIADGRIQEVPLLDENDEPEFHDDGTPKIQFVETVQGIDPETGEELKIERIVTAPVAPEDIPVLDDRSGPVVYKRLPNGKLERDADGKKIALNGAPLGLEDIKLFRQFQRKMAEREALIAERDKILESLHQSIGEETAAFEKLINDKTLSTKQKKALIESIQPDVRGYTEISRKAFERTVERLDASEKKIDSIDSQMDEIRQKYVELAGESLYMKDPSLLQEIVTEEAYEELHPNDKGDSA